MQPTNIAFFSLELIFMDFNKKYKLSMQTLLFVGSNQKILHVFLISVTSKITQTVNN